MDREDAERAKERDRLQVELRAYRDIQAHMGDSAPATPAARSGVTPRSRGGSHLSEKWKQAFRLLYHPDGFDYDAMVAAAAEIGVNAEKKAIRPRAQRFTDTGYFERIGAGRFKLTEKAIVAMGGLETALINRKAPAE